MSRSTSRYGTTWQDDPMYSLETELETRLGDLGWVGSKKLPYIRLAGIISLSLGIRGYSEVALGAIAVAIAYFSGVGNAPDGIDGAINALSGVQLARGQYKTVAIPVILELMELFHKFRNGILMSRKSLITLAIFSVAYGLTLFKVIK